MPSFPYRIALFLRQRTSGRMQPAELHPPGEGRMGLEIEVTYENGVLKLPRPLPLVEGATVRITIHPPDQPGLVKHVQIPWTGSLEELHRFLDDSEEGIWGVR